MADLQDLVQFLTQHLPILTSLGEAAWSDVKDKVAKGVTEKSWNFACKCWRLLKGKLPADSVATLCDDPTNAEAQQLLEMFLEVARTTDISVASSLQSLLAEGTRIGTLVTGDQISNTKIGKQMRGNVYIGCKFTTYNTGYRGVELSEDADE